MNALAIILNIVLILISIVLIAVVLMQQGQRQGLGAIAGGAETFFGKNGKGADVKLAKITKIAAVVFIVLAIATTMVVSHSNGYEAQSGAYLDGDHIHLEDGTTVDLVSATDEQLAQLGLDAETAAALAEALAAEEDGDDHSDHVHNEDGTITDLEGNVITEEEAHGEAEPEAEAEVAEAAEATEAPVEATEALAATEAPVEATEAPAAE